MNLNYTILADGMEATDHKVNVSVWSVMSTTGCLRVFVIVCPMQKHTVNSVITSDIYMYMSLLI